jgi:predicted AlkP superfamily phosphohydrolase/phosphomutase
VGREPQGIVQPGTEAHALLDELAHYLMAARDDQGREVFQQVLLAPDGAAGQLDNWGWDLMPLPRDEPFYWYRSAVTGDSRLITEAPFFMTGQHRPEGILIARGPAIAPGLTLPGARIVDITPTALYLMGLPVPEEMDGQVLVDIVRADWLAAHPVQTTADSFDTWHPERTAVYSPEDRDRVEGALRALGYVD